MSDVLKRWYPGALIAFAALVSIVVYSHLPERIATHFDVDGYPNGWMPRAMGAFVLPAFMLVLWGILRAVPAIDPRRENFAKFGKSYDLVVAASLTLLAIIHVVILAVGLGYHVNIGRLAPVLIGVFFVVMGNVMPLARPNFMYGIRTPWTLSNDKVWARTHRLGGYTMTGAGVVIVVAGLLLPPDVSMGVLVGASIASILAPAVYSYLTWKREMKK